MSLRKDRVKIFGIVIAILTIFSVLLITGAKTFQIATEQPLYNASKNLKKGDTEVVTEEVLSYVPQEATSVYSVVPKSKEDTNKWWTQFLLTSKYRLTPTIELGSVSDHVKQMTLFNIPAKDSYAEEAVIILELKNKKTGMEDLDHMIENIPSGSDTLIRNPKDNLLVLSSPLAFDSVMEVVESGKNSLKNNKEFVNDTKEVKDALLWFNFGGFLESITSEGVKKQNPEAVETITKKLMGFKDDTRWIGKSNDYGKSWVGTFPSGGYDRDIQNIEEFTQAVNEDVTYESETEKGSEGNNDSSEDKGTEDKGSEDKGSENSEDAKKADDDTPAGEGDIDMGSFVAGPLMMVSESVSVIAKEKDEKGKVTDKDTDKDTDKGTDNTIEAGQVTDPYTGKLVKAKGDLKYYDTVVTLSPGMLTNSLSFAGIPLSNISLYTFNIKEGEMKATIDYISDDVENETIETPDDEDRASTQDKEATEK